MGYDLYSRVWGEGVGCRGIEVKCVEQRNQCLRFRV
jgi:hypothetical protein